MPKCREDRRRRVKRSKTNERTFLAALAKRLPPRRGYSSEYYEACNVRRDGKYIKWQTRLNKAGRNLYDDLIKQFGHIDITDCIREAMAHKEEQQQ